MSQSDPTELQPLSYAAPDHRAERNRRLKLTLIVAVFTKPLSLLSRLVIAPLLLHYLGSEGYGVYAAVLSAAALLGLTNLGIHLGLINRLLDCHVDDDKERAGRYVSSLLISSGTMVAFCIVLWTLAAIFVPWARVLHVHNPRWAAQTSWAVWIAGTATLVGLVLGFSTSVYAGYQENARSLGWDAATKLCTFAATLTIVYTQWGLIGVALATCVSQVLVMLANTLTLFYYKPWLRPRLSKFGWQFVRSTLGQGIFLFALQGAVSVIYQCDKLVISTTLTAADVTLYSFVGDLFIVAYGFYMMILGPLWSFHGDALRRGDWAWASKGLRLTTIAGLLCIGTCFTALLLKGDLIFRIWTRGQVTHVPRGLIVAIGCMFLTRVWIDCRSILLNAAGMVRPQVFFFLTHAALNLTIALIFVRRFGVLGIAWATPISALATTVWGSSWMIRRLTLRYAGPVPPSLTPAPLPTVV